MRQVAMSFVAAFGLLAVAGCSPSTPPAGRTACHAAVTNRLDGYAINGWTNEKYVDGTVDGGTVNYGDGRAAAFICYLSGATVTSVQVNDN